MTCLGQFCYQRGCSNCTFLLLTLKHQSIKTLKHKNIKTLKHTGKITDQISLKDNAQIQNEIIWNNNSILINKNTIFFKQWYQNGIIRLQDLLGVDCTFLCSKNSAKIATTTQNSNSHISPTLIRSVRQIPRK